MNTNAILNPFRYIAGAKSLIIGLVVMAATSLLLYTSGWVQDSYCHFAIAAKPLWEVAAMQLLWWVIPSVLLYVCGLVLSPSRIRIVDVFGTQAFCQILVLLMAAPLFIPSASEAMRRMIEALLSGNPFLPEDTTLVICASIFSVVILILYFAWSYRAFATSCNISGAKAIITFSIIQAATMTASSIFSWHTQQLALS